PPPVWMRSSPGPVVIQSPPPSPKMRSLPPWTAQITSERGVPRMTSSPLVPRMVHGRNGTASAADGTSTAAASKAAAPTMARWERTNRPYSGVSGDAARDRRPVTSANPHLVEQEPERRVVLGIAHALRNEVDRRTGSGRDDRGAVGDEMVDGPRRSSGLRTLVARRRQPARPQPPSPFVQHGPLPN